ncbi:thioredoxin family protein [Micromonospora sp. NBC_01796]|uniref:thioredoxin family protein n=1 Tax=Micromonospora sp. NBC_01796 TaxID=2975987 RepID=UPI002DD9A0A7|nr:thioredoxin family protein [Micromonospora sp. NBC_01796]WSA83351.1 thioredoxin family protein [Micromonospora sp. NBC_01796]
MQDSALTGSFVVVAVLVAATAFGLWRRRRDGRLRPVPARPAPAEGRTAVAEGRTVSVRGQSEQPQDRPADDPGAPGMVVEPALLAALGVLPGTPATLLQFSSAFCAPCRATRRVLGEVTGLLDGVRHVEVDAESQLAAVRALNIWRTPTVLVVDGAGRIVQRATGVPGKAQVIAALAPLLAASGDTAGGRDREGAGR